LISALSRVASFNGLRTALIANGVPSFIGIVVAWQYSGFARVFTALGFLEDAMDYANGTLNTLSGTKQQGFSVTKQQGLMHGLAVALPRACVVAAMAVRDMDEAKLKAAEEERSSRSAPRCWAGAATDTSRP